MCEYKKKREGNKYDTREQKRSQHEKETKHDLHFLVSSKNLFLYLFVITIRGTKMRCTGK